MEIYEIFILVAKREYLELFQQGQLYMGSCLYYQMLETNDSHKGDIYDGAIKCSSVDYPIPDEIKNNTTNHRIMVDIATYIKCFYHVQHEEITYLNNGQIMISIPPKSIDELLKLNANEALIVFLPSILIQRFQDACEHYEIIKNFFWGDVSYIDEDKYIEYEKQINEVSNGNSTVIPQNPIFIKRKQYSPQKEFRIAVTLDMDNPQSKIDENTISKPRIFQMRDIKDISTIVKFDDLLKPVFSFN